MSTQSPPLFDPGAALFEALECYIRHADFKRLLNALVRARARAPFKSISILSEFPGEGRSFITAVLALGFSRFLGMKTLILDTHGSSQALFERLITETHHARSRAPELCSREQLQSSSHKTTGDFRLSSFLNDLYGRHDIIVIDSAPLSLAQTAEFDPVIVATQSHTALLVTSPRSLDREVCSRVRDELLQSEISLIGTIYNAALTV